MEKLELLSPAGNIKKLETAFYYGADAVYLGGNRFGLRAYAGNFADGELVTAVKLAHTIGKKVYVTVNIYAYNSDIVELGEYLSFLESIGVDAVIMSDLGVIATARKVAPKLEIHISTQANITNYMAAQAFVDLGAKRLVLARELSLTDIKGIRDNIGDDIELESFVHGAMCVAYSGRCLLSTYLTPRNSNRGECVQACRWEYKLMEKSRQDTPMTIAEDKYGTYIMNSKDLNMVSHVGDLIDAGISSFKIEGRMKSEYYVATVTNAYRRAIDNYMNGIRDEKIFTELDKTANRQYTTGFYYKDKNEDSLDTINYDNAQSVGDYDFVASVIGYDEIKKAIILEQRNRFIEGDELQILSNGDNYNKTIVCCGLTDMDGKPVPDAKYVQQLLLLPSDIRLSKNDILRRRIR